VIQLLSRRSTVVFLLSPCRAGLVARAQVSLFFFSLFLSLSVVSAPMLLENGAPTFFHYPIRVRLFLSRRAFSQYPLTRPPFNPLAAPPCLGRRTATVPPLFSLICFPCKAIAPPKVIPAFPFPPSRGLWAPCDCPTLTLPLLPSSLPLRTPTFFRSHTERSLSPCVALFSTPESPVRM